MCIFCKIIDKEIPAKVVYEDKCLLAFEDTNPKAPVHILIIPKKHIDSLQDLSENDLNIIASITKAAKEIAKLKNIAESGYRLVVNNGPDAGQAVPHLHYHLLGGRLLQWPPG